jgi:hypothetical protein
MLDAGTSDVIDAMVGASARDDAVITSDAEDLARLAEALRPGRSLPIIRV